MKRLLISLSILLVLFLSGCTPMGCRLSSSPIHHLTSAPKGFFPDSNPEKKLKKDCNLNNGDSCFRLGVFYGIKCDYKNAKFYFHKACNLNSDQGCKGLADILRYQENDYNNSSKYYLKSCTLYNSAACYTLCGERGAATFVFSGSDNNTKRAYKNKKLKSRKECRKAINHLKKACNLKKDGYACLTLFRFLRKSEYYSKASHIFGPGRIPYGRGKGLYYFDMFYIWK